MQLSKYPNVNLDNPTQVSELMEHLKKEIDTGTSAIKELSEKLNAASEARDKLLTDLRIMCGHNKSLMYVEEFHYDYDMGHLYEIVCSDCGYSITTIFQSALEEFIENCNAKGISITKGSSKYIYPEKSAN